MALIKRRAFGLRASIFLYFSEEKNSVSQVKIGVIGGSGLYQMESLTDVEEIHLETPFGKPSDAFIVGNLGGVGVAFLPRHARGHLLTPTEIHFRANIY